MGQQQLRPKTIAGCQPLKLKFTQLSRNVVNTIIWSPKPTVGLKFKIDTSYALTDTGLSSKWYFKTVNQWGCIAQDSFYLVQFEKPKFTVSTSLVRQCKSQNSLQITDNQYNGIDSVVVAWGDNQTSRLKSNEILHHFMDTGTYHWMGIKKTPYGCEDTSVGALKILPDSRLNYTQTTLSTCPRNPNVAVNTTDSNFESHAIYWQDGSNDTLRNGTKIHSYSKPGTYQPMVVSVSKSNCIDTQELAIMAVNYPSELKFKRISDSICAGQTWKLVMHNALNSTIDRDSAVVEVWWANKIVQKVKARDTLIELAGLGPGFYNVGLKLHSKGSCNDSVGWAFRVFSAPQLTVLTNATCDNLESKATISFKSLLAVKRLQYNLAAWGITGEQYMPKNPSKLNFGKLVASSSWLKISATDVQGCSALDSAWVTVNESPKAQFTFAEKLVGVSDQEFQFVDQSVGANRWAWDFGPWGSSTNQNPKLVVPLNQGVVVVLNVANDFGCIDTATKLVQVTHKWEFSFPNALSLNGDGLNDVFSCQEWQWIKDLTVKIYNRWGEKIYESNDPKFQWTPSQTGTYIYLISLTDLKHNKHYLRGDVQVLK